MWKIDLTDLLVQFYGKEVDARKVFQDRPICIASVLPCGRNDCDDEEADYKYTYGELTLIPNVSVLWGLPETDLLSLIVNYDQKRKILPVMFVEKEREVESWLNRLRKRNESLPLLDRLFIVKLETTKETGPH